MVDIRSVDPTQTRPLRQRLLRPHQTLEELAHPDEARPGTGAFVALVADDVVGTALVFAANRPGESGATSWRLISMAVDPAHRRTGVGRALLERCLGHVRAHGGDEVWCHARTASVGFYERSGFEGVGPEWVEEHTGPHLLMWRRL